MNNLSVQVFIADFYVNDQDENVNFLPFRLNVVPEWWFNLTYHVNDISINTFDQGVRVNVVDKNAFDQDYHTNIPTGIAFGLL